MSLSTPKKPHRKTWTDRYVHYLNVISEGPLIIVRVPFPMPKWAAVLKALTPVLREHGQQRKSVSSIEGLVPDPDQRTWTNGDRLLAAKLDAAFAGGPATAKFHLYDWVDGKFNLVRKAIE